MFSAAHVRLLEVDPDLGSFLSAEERAEARQLAVPVRNVGRDEDGGLDELMKHGAFGALVLEGMVLRQLRVGDQLGMTVLGPGDIIGSGSGAMSMLVAGASFRALPGTRLALLGREVLVATRRWPALVATLQARYAQQADRLATQMVICQLPRVDQRLLSLMWLLAESWGRVTPAGTTLPLRLTHDALGALVGARRPTVSLALRALTDRGAIIRQDLGWLLTDAPAESSQSPETVRAPVLIEEGPTSWSAEVEPASEVKRRTAEELSNSYATLVETISALRRQHAQNRERFSVGLQAMVTARQRCAESRQRVARERISRRRAPSA